MTEKLKFYNADFCPFGERAWIALEEKGIPYEWIVVNYWDREAPLTKKLFELNPNGTLPTLEFEGKGIYESYPLIEYLEDRFPKSKSLRPKGSYNAWLTRVYSQSISDKLLPAFYRFLMNTNPEEEETKKKAFLESLDWVNEILSKHNEGEDYFFGNDFTIIDAMLIPFLNRIFTLIPHYHKVEVPKTLSRIYQYREKCNQRPSLKVVSADRIQKSLEGLPIFVSKERENFLIEVYSIYASNCVADAKKLVTDAFANKTEWEKIPFQEHLKRAGLLKSL